jgi:hypothetical protein
MKRGRKPKKAKQQAEFLNDVFNGEEPNYKPQFDNEIDLKVAMFKDSIERGEVDQINIDQSFKARKRKADLIASCTSDRKLVFHEKRENNENQTRTNAA